MTVKELKFFHWMKLYKMKNILFILLFLSLSNLYCQTREDQLLERDHKQVIERLKFMQYLTNATLKLKWHVEKAGDTLQIPFYTYYKDSIVADNPVPSSNISSYLGYQPNAIPASAGEFIVKVYNRNAATFYNIIDRYGYPTTAKLNKYEKIDPRQTALIIEKASDEWKKILYPVIQRENRKGNMTELEFMFCKFAFRNGIIRGYEIEEYLNVLKRNGYKPPIVHQ